MMHINPDALVLNGKPEFARYELSNDTQLANKTFNLIQGGFIDIVAPVDSSMAMNRVTYTPGLKALRKCNGTRLTYRFQVPTDSRPGDVFTISALGNGTKPPFTFLIRTVRS